VIIGAGECADSILLSVDCSVFSNDLQPNRQIRVIAVGRQALRADPLLARTGSDAEGPPGDRSWHFCLVGNGR